MDNQSRHTDHNRRANIVLIGFLLVSGFYLFTEHRAHVFGILPYLIFLACPLMHLFMHHGHSHGGADSWSTERAGVGLAGEPNKDMQP